MDVGRMSDGERIAAVGGIVLIISLFLTWVGEASGWESNNTFDLYLLITAAVAIAAAVGIGLPLAGVTMDGAAALLGAVATILLLWLIIFDWFEGADREIGLFIALIASAAIAYGGSRAATGGRTDGRTDTRTT